MKSADCISDDWHHLLRRLTEVAVLPDVIHDILPLERVHGYGDGDFLGLVGASFHVGDGGDEVVDLDDGEGGHRL